MSDVRIHAIQDLPAIDTTRELMRDGAATTPRQSTYATARAAAIAEFERRWVMDALERAAHNVSKCARDNGLDRVYLHRIMRRHGVKAVVAK